MLKDIIVPLAARAAADHTATFAISLAAAFEAHLTGISFAYEAALPAIAGVGDAMSIEWVAAQRAQYEADAKAAVERFDAEARRAGIAAEPGLVRISTANAADSFVRMARCRDLAVVRQPDPEEPRIDDLFVEAALFGSGRPLLVVPYIQAAGFKLDRAMVCWDGRRNSARAVADAMPFLLKARSVEIVSVLAQASKDQTIGTDIARHLARHGVKAEVNRLVAPDTDVPNTILSHAADTSCDLIVMGGYGSSRLREFVLGGATRGILETMTIPTLMAH